MTKRPASWRELAQTYSGGYHADAVGMVAEFEAFEKEVAADPEASDYRIAQKLDLPRGRVQAWKDGSVPDAVRGVRLARDRDWLPVVFGKPATGALVVLVAATFAGGSIARETWVPSWHVDDDRVREHLMDALETLGLGGRIEEREGRADELLPTEDASVLGRLLVAMGAPRGPKAQWSAIQLPEWLSDAPGVDRRAFVRTYLLMRGSWREEERRPGAWVQVKEERSDQFLSSLAALMEDVVGESVTYSEGTIRVPRSAIESLFGTAQP